MSKIMFEYEDADFKKIPVKQKLSQYTSEDYIEQIKINDAMDEDEKKAITKLNRCKNDKSKKLNHYLYQNIDYDELIKRPDIKAEIAILMGQRLYDRKYKREFARNKFGYLCKENKEIKEKSKDNFKRRTKLDLISPEMSKNIYDDFQIIGLSQTGFKYNMTDYMIRKIVDNYKLSL
jgi:hypothetical protein